MKLLVFTLMTTAAFASIDGGVPALPGSDGGVRDAGAPPKRSRADAGVRSVQPVEAQLGGPTKGCPADCYTSCGGGAAREPGAPIDRRCAGCRNICMDTGNWPPGVRREPTEGSPRKKPAF